MSVKKVHAGNGAPVAALLLGLRAKRLRATPRWRTPTSQTSWYKDVLEMCARYRYPRPRQRYHRAQEHDPVPAGALGSVQRRVSPAEKPRQPGADFPVGGDADTHGGAHRKSAHEAGGFGKLRPQTLRRLDGFFTVYARLERVYSNPMQAKQAILAEAPVRQLS